MPVRAVLFDLDGTLADTAPDLVAAVNNLLQSHGRPALPYETLRPLASAGARGLVGAAFGSQPGDADYADLRDAFLANYERDICRLTQLFPGVVGMLAWLQSRQLQWGIVTNKLHRFTSLLLQQLPLQTAAVVSGDTTAHAKPHPLPLLHAAQLLNVPAQDCWYVGDDLRDIQAGQAAGMRTIAAAYGYCGEKTDPTEWGADSLIHHPQELIPLLQAQISREC